MKYQVFYAAEEITIGEHDSQVEGEVIRPILVPINDEENDDGNS